MIYCFHIKKKIKRLKTYKGIQRINYIFFNYKLYIFFIFCFLFLYIIKNNHIFENDVICCNNFLFLSLKIFFLLFSFQSILLQKIPKEGQEVLVMESIKFYLFVGIDVVFFHLQKIIIINNLIFILFLIQNLMKINIINLL